MKGYKIFVLVFLTIQGVASLPTPPQGLLRSEESKLNFHSNDGGNNAAKSSQEKRNAGTADVRRDAGVKIPPASSASLAELERRFIDFRQIDHMKPTVRKLASGALTITGVGALGTYGGVVLAKHIRDKKKQKEHKKKEREGNDGDKRKIESTIAQQQSESLRPRNLFDDGADVAFSSLVRADDSDEEKSYVSKRARRLVSGRKDWIRLGVAGLATAVAAGSIYSVVKWYKDRDAKLKKEAAEAAKNPSAPGPGPAPSPQPRSLHEWDGHNDRVDTDKTLPLQQIQKRSIFDSSKKRKSSHGFFGLKKKGTSRKKHIGIGIGAGLIGFGSAVAYGQFQRLKQQQQEQEAQQQEQQLQPHTQPQPAAKAPPSPSQVQPRSLVEDDGGDIDRTLGRSAVVPDENQTELLAGRDPRDWKTPLLGMGIVSLGAGGIAAYYIQKLLRERKEKKRRKKEEEEARARTPGGCKRDIDEAHSGMSFDEKSESDGENPTRGVSSRAKKIIAGSLAAGGVIAAAGGALGYRAWKKLHPKRSRFSRVMGTPTKASMSLYGRSTEAGNPT